MKKSRVIWGLWLGSGGDLLLRDRWSDRISVAGSFNRIAAAVGNHAFCCPGKDGCAADTGSLREKGKAVTGKLLVKNRSFLPADRLRCRVCCENLLTGEKEYTNIPVAAPARSGVDTEFQLKSRHTGKVRISLKSWYGTICSVCSVPGFLSGERRWQSV